MTTWDSGHQEDWVDGDIDQFYASDWKVFVGNDETNTGGTNVQCESATYLQADGVDLYDESSGDYEEEVSGNIYWNGNYGFEAWCNAEGRYTIFQANTIPEDQIVVCALGVMGTKYERATEAETEVYLVQGQS